jgi:hypothetical protein
MTVRFGNHCHSAVREGGLGSFDRIALEKKLAGKLANVTPSISEPGWG